MNRTREDERPTQLPALPHPPTSTSQQTDTPNPGRVKQRGSNTPPYPHLESESGNQLPPIRNLVPNLWEPGTSKSSLQVASGEGTNGSTHRLYPVSPVRGSGPVDVDDRHVLRPQLETSHHEHESNQDTSRQVNESNKRPPSSPIEREDHARITPSNGALNSNRWTAGHVHKPSQTPNPAGENHGVRSRSNSEAAKPTGESSRSGPQSSHQQGLLRDPVGKLGPRLMHRQLTILSFHFSIQPYGSF